MISLWNSRLGLDLHSILLDQLFEKLDVDHLLLHWTRCSIIMFDLDSTLDGGLEAFKTRLLGLALVHATKGACVLGFDLETV